MCSIGTWGLLVALYSTVTGYQLESTWGLLVALYSTVTGYRLESTWGLLVALYSTVTGYRLESTWGSLWWHFTAQSLAIDWKVSGAHSGGTLQHSHWLSTGKYLGLTLMALYSTVTGYRLESTWGSL